MVRRSDRYETEFSTDGDSASFVVAKAVAAIEGVPVTALPCLGEHLEAESLNRLLESSQDVEVHFLFEEYQIVVRGDGTLTIREQD